MNFPVCLFVSEIGRLRPTFANSIEGECRPGEKPIEVAPSEERLPDEIELNTVTISNMSIDSKSVETDGITVDSGAGESVVNPDEWPSVDLKPSKGSVKGQRYVGPGGEKINNLRELTVTERTARHGGVTSQVE